MLLKVINKVKVTHQGQSLMRKIIILLISTNSILCVLLQIINMVKVTHNGQGHIKVKVKTLYLSDFM